MIKGRLPLHLGGHEVELESEGLTESELIVGWVDEYGTITNNLGARIGDLVSVKNNDLSAIVLKDWRLVKGF